jgi:hypothetical protein
MSAVLSAQVRLAGRVTNDTNTPVTNATVTVRAPGDAAARKRAFTDPSGNFTLQLPAAGDYLLDVEAVGFYSLKDRAVVVGGGPQDLSITLNPVREFAESVDVTASSASIGLDQTAPEQTLTGAQMIDIPFPVTHDVKTAMRALPNVVQDNRSNIHVNGGAENETLYLLDGFNIGDPLTGNFDTRLSLEGIQSMTVETGSVSAEHGKGSAGVVSINMRSGDDRIRYSGTNFIPGIDSNKGIHLGSWNPRINLSGPVRRGRLWFSDSLWGQYNQTVIQELPAGQDTAQSFRYSNFLHVQANLTPTNIASFGFLTSLWTASDTGLGALDPVQTTVDRRSRQWFAYAKDQIYFGHSAIAEFGFASNRTFSRQIPHGTDLYVYTPSGRTGNYFVRGTQNAARDQALANAYLPSYNWFGVHQFKAGLDVDRLGYGQNLDRTGFEWLDVNNAPIRRVLYGGNGRLKRNNIETSAYIQDGWRVRSNVLLEVGLRSDWDRVLGNWTRSPRAGVAWSPAAFENTRISAGYAISYDATNLELFTRPYDQYPITYYYPPYGLPTEPVRSLFEIGGRFRSPRFSTFNFGVDHRFGSNLFVRMQAIRRRGTNGLSYVGATPLSTLSDSIYRLSNARSDGYEAVELTVRQNFHKEFGWLASYTRSRARSSEVTDIAADTALLVGANAGRLAWDAPHRLLGWGYLPAFRKDWAVAYLVEYRSGFPFSVVNNAGQVVGDVNGSRYPDFFELNLHIEKRFQFRGQRWAGRAGFNNITGHRNPNTVDNIVGSAQFLNFYGGQSRALQFRIRWLGKL